MNHDGAVADDRRIKSKRAYAWQKPDWELVKESSTWKVTITPQFHHSVKEMRSKEKFIAFNTLIKVALPSEKDLASLPRPGFGWQITALKNCDDLQIVWCAKDGGAKMPGGDMKKKMRPIIQAHFAGSYKDCLRFTQTHPILPKGAARVKRDLSGVESVENAQGQSQKVEYSWTLTRVIGDAILDRNSSLGEGTPLVEGTFDLDPLQKEALQTPLPLMLESGSGTGKTNVLFQASVICLYIIHLVLLLIFLTMISTNLPTHRSTLLIMLTGNGIMMKADASASSL